MADYCVRINNIGEPAHKGISNKNIKEFGNLLKNGSSDFSRWFTKNKQNLYNTIKNTGESKMANELNDYYSMDIFNKISVMVGGSNLAVFGGILFLVAIVYYMFYRNQTKTNVLEKLNDVQQGGTIEQIYSNFSIVYRISKDSKEYALKISNKKGINSRKIAYAGEIENYTILNRDPKLENLVLKMYGGGNFEITRGEPFNFYFTNGKLFYSITPEHNEIYNGIITDSNVCKNDDGSDGLCIGSYIITEFAIGYDTLKDVLLTHPDIPDIKKSVLFENILRTIIYMFDKHNFIHGDLHGGNVLVNPETLEFKIYDFDQSEIVSNKSNWDYLNLFTSGYMRNNIMKLAPTLGINYKDPDVIKKLARLTSGLYDMFTVLCYITEIYEMYYPTNKRKYKITAELKNISGIQLYEYAKKWLSYDGENPGVIPIPKNVKYIGQGTSLDHYYGEISEDQRQQNIKLYDEYKNVAQIMNVANAIKSNFHLSIPDYDYIGSWIRYTDIWAKTNILEEIPPLPFDLKKLGLLYTITMLRNTINYNKELPTYGHIFISESILKDTLMNIVDQYQSTVSRTTNDPFLEIPSELRHIKRASEVINLKKIHSTIDTNEETASAYYKYINQLINLSIGSNIPPILPELQKYLA